VLLCVASVLDGDQLNELKRLIAGQPFEEGSRTAGWAAQGVKNNSQLSTRASHQDAIQTLVKTALANNVVFTAAAAPHSLRPVLISRYERGMGYGDHVDNAMMGEARTDLSFTLFISDESDYEGGELVIDESSGSREIKLPAGSMVLYPSGYLHRVNIVTRGCRLVAVGWLQSLIRRADQREILFELETLRQQMFLKEGKTTAFDSLSKSVSNLWRMWSEP
jgi:PKHD-type hydroxylase